MTPCWGRALWIASATAPTSSSSRVSPTANALRQAQSTENEPEGYELNHEGPRENAATAFPTRLFSSFEQEMGLRPENRAAGSLRSDGRQGAKPAARRSARTSLRVLDCLLAPACVLLWGAVAPRFTE